MKKITFFALVVLSTFVNLSAQTNSTSVSSGNNGSFYVQYNPMTYKIDYSGADDQNFNGFTIGYNHTVASFEGSNLSLEVGGALLYSRWSDSEEHEKFDEDVSVNLWALKVPASLVYDWKVSDAVSIKPYAGLNLRFNISAKEKWEATSEYDMYNEKDDVNLMDKKDMGSKDDTWGRVQFGWHIGTNVEFNNKWFLGVSYGSDFTEVCKKCKFSTVSITLGMKL